MQMLQVSMKLFRLVVVALALTGCAALPAIIQGVAQGVQWLSSLVDDTEGKADTYFARHPNEKAEREVTREARRLRAVIVTLNALLRAGEAVAAEDITAAREAVLEAYSAYLAALNAYGVPQAYIGGGAETNAPIPEPFLMPTIEDVRAKL